MHRRLSENPLYEKMEQYPIKLFTDIRAKAVVS